MGKIKQQDVILIILQYPSIGYHHYFRPINNTIPVSDGLISDFVSMFICEFGPDTVQ